MSINLWKLGGKPTSYNPLPAGPAGGGNAPAVPLSLGSFVVRFKASSATNARLNLVDSGAVGISQTITLTTTPTQYEFSIERKVLNGGNVFYIADIDSRGNVVITDIQLVQKPLPKLTINGINGFNSGKWTLHANASVVDDETLVLNATGASQNISLIFNVIPGNIYTASLQSFGDSSFIARINRDSLWGSSVGTIPLNGSVSFTVPQGVNMLYFNIYSNGIGQFTFKRPMLNLGSIPAPYEKKRGERMVMPVPKVNLFDGALELGVYGGADGIKQPSVNAIRSVNKIPVKPLSTIFLSNTKNYQMVTTFYDAQGVFVSTPGDMNGKSLMIPNNVCFVVFRTSTGNNENDLTTKFQLEQGTIPTPYQPYAVQLNKKPQRYVPKKNLFDGYRKDYTGFGSTSFNGNVLTVTGTWYVSYKFNVKPNTNYRISGSASGTVNSITYVWADSGGSTVIASNVLNTIFNTGNYSVIYIAFYSGNASSGVSTYTNIQLEEGTATPYEPYAPVLPKARTGLSFNGDYLQLPSMTMDSVEIDCLIDAVQPNGAQAMMMDARSGLTNGWVFVSNSGNGNGIQSVTGLVQGVRTKVKITPVSSFTDNVTFFTDNAAGVSRFTKATLYKVTCYLAGQIVAQYDFENPSNIVGNQVLQSAKNLIPSFEDARWSLHANTQVLGKDVLRLVVVSFSTNEFFIDCIPNTSYIFRHNGNGKLQLASFNNGVELSNTYGATSITHNTHANATKLRARLVGDVAGTFDFIKPQLYQLDGKEGTINGKPIQLNKSSKRTLYSKR